MDITINYFANIYRNYVFGLNLISTYNLCKATLRVRPGDSQTCLQWPPWAVKTVAFVDGWPLWRGPVYKSPGQNWPLYRTYAGWWHWNHELDLASFMCTFDTYKAQNWSFYFHILHYYLVENVKWLLNCTGIGGLITSIAAMSKSDYAICVNKPGRWLDSGVDCYWENV